VPSSCAPAVAALRSRAQTVRSLKSALISQLSKFFCGRSTLRV